MEAVQYYKALADETRLRLLNLLIHHELNVNEIVNAMGMGQPRISRHLKILTECGLLKFRRDGLWVFYSATREGQGGWFNKLFQDFIESDNDVNLDYEKMKLILDEGMREKTRFFDSIASDWDDLKRGIIGTINISDEIVGRITNCNIAADLGCGTGELLLPIKKKAKRVIGVDKSPKMLEEAGHKLALNGKGIELRIGEMEHLPMRDQEADVAVINMVLHHLPSPDSSILEAGRVLKKGGLLIIVDLEKHQNEEMRKKFEHRWLGFTRKNIERWLVAGGFVPKEFVQYDARDDMKIDLFVSVKQ
ncbi:MAG TPA: metalloregulator ArsR/SmtB family transcription factor [Spirochaetota bacterium]|nr:metalloregulator ArsR/SmtB family transcription factor [Spirochaetota bacterium]HPC42812.1 metalloregulator ArsR/SmtB family transcription factor [Spirochaetota bacterium]HPL19191.1 metalloregulator ArsR/SmtB family transcription factor [Spirochaetota bacterium]HQF08985.1 metalloregulator ArsR/SmtB family transcription factor [Spirochaetota bacterium]HQH97873.1 metalloregulator ArsR/SmtB family transcription factor [Spirochaetota bacterium]